MPTQASSLATLVTAVSLALTLWPLGTTAGQQGALTVTAAITVTASPGLTGPPADRSGVVVWLTPEGQVSPATRPDSQARPRFRIVQRGKQFQPRVLVVPTGAVVDFPNVDPIFHNVFSLFEGKRFDLGLYEAGSSRSVTFTSPGVSYVFCNIHPEMSAVVVTVGTEHYASSNRAGTVTLTGVPPGQYRLAVWHERLKPANANEYPKTVTVGSQDATLPAIRLVDGGRVLTTHKNKFGHDYVPPGAAQPIYKQ